MMKLFFQTSLLAIFFQFAINSQVLAGHLVEDLKYITLKAEKGDENAQNILASRYMLGLGVAKNIPLAIKWFGKAAENNQPQALFNLGRIYEQGIGVPKNIPIAVSYYEKAAQLKEPKALNLIGHLYDGYIYDELKDPKKAVYWYRKGAENGSVSSQNNLAIAYKQGEGVEKNLVKAMFWLSVAGKTSYETVRDQTNQLNNELTAEEKTEVQHLVEFWEYTGIYPKE